MPFFATLFMAAAFFYFQYTYTKFKVVDFSKCVFYGKEFIFTPTDEQYIVLLYNSKVSSFKDLAKQVRGEFGSEGAVILAIDYYQNTALSGENGVIALSAGMDTLLKFSAIFKIENVPSAFKIKKKSISKYAQDSKIRALHLIKDKK